MLIMFSVFAVLFLKDGIWGYREGNLHFYVHKTFDKAGVKFQEMQNGDDRSEADWKTFAAKEKCLPHDTEDILPKGTDVEMPWPAILVDGYATMKEKGGQNGSNKLWEEYTSEKGWDAKTGEHPMWANKIREQFVAASVALVLILGALFILIRTMRRTIEVDGEALTTQEGCRILFTDMVRVDKRKWDTKGIALVYYNDGGEEKKAKIDGMVYGQFKAEDGAPAEKLFARVMENFKGEVLEYVEVDEEAGDDGDSAIL